MKTESYPFGWFFSLQFVWREHFFAEFYRKSYNCYFSLLWRFRFLMFKNFFYKILTLLDFALYLTAFLPILFLLLLNNWMLKSLVLMLWKDSNYVVLRNFKQKIIFIDKNGQLLHDGGGLKKGAKRWSNYLCLVTASFEIVKATFLMKYPKNKVRARNAYTGSNSGLASASLPRRNLSPVDARNK